MTAPDTIPPCGWDLDTQTIPGWADAEPSQQATAKAVAVYVLWALSGRRFGVCQVVLRPGTPTRQTCDPLAGLHGYPVAATHAYHLPGPVVSVDEVLIDGEVLDPDSYRLHQGALYRDGIPWPAVNDMSLEATEPGTWQITYRRGQPVPKAGELAAGILAGEILRSMRNQAGPRIPQRAQSIAREGVNIQMLDPEAFLKGGRTGIPEVDLFLAAVNPRELAAAPVVWSPDVDPHKAVAPAPVVWW